jgi:FemAB-related protein (PEP-CTERM system-associated)
MNLSTTDERIINAGCTHTDTVDVKVGNPGSSVRILQDSDLARWDQYVSASDEATCYHLSGWKSVIEQSFKHKAYYLFAEDSKGQIQGILPLVNLKSILFGNFLISMPYFNYGGICANGADYMAQLMDAAISIAIEHKAAHIELRHFRPLAFSLSVKTTKVAMRLQLPSDPDDLWKSLSSKLRSQIKRPMKEGMYAALGGEECLDHFYDVFAENMRDLGTPVYGKDFFRNILIQFPSSTRICTVFTKEGIAVASGFLVGFKKVLEIPWASSLRSHRNSSPNMLLYWTSLKYACENGYTTFDFGRSTPGEGTYKFKEQWGAKPVQLFWHYWLRNDSSLPELNPHNPKYRMAVKVWRKLPLSITKLIGPAIVGNLP